MKNIIAIASLLAAGTALANAETILTTTFGNAAQSSATAVTLTNEWAEGLTFDAVTGKVVSLTNASGNVSIKYTGVTSTTQNPLAAKDASFFSPNTNVGDADGKSNGKPWTATFAYTGGVSNITTLDSISLSVGLFNSEGTWQGKDASWFGNVTFTATIIDASTNSELGSFTGKLRDTDGVTGDEIKGKGAEKFAVSLTGTSIDLSSVSNVNVKLALTDRLNNGCFVGLQNIAYSGTVIPEPSAFGLLAGAGALAFVAARRRRRAK